MASLTTPLSVRLSDEDTGFLAALEIDGAVTASDKIRGLIRQARQRSEPIESYSEALSASHEHMTSALRALRLIGADLDMHSDVAVGLLGVAEEYLALALAVPRPGPRATRDEVVRYESRLVDCAARMTAQLLRWGVTPHAPAYDPAVVSRHLAGLVELMRLVSAAEPAR
jgi:hypothetical protein